MASCGGFGSIVSPPIRLPLEAASEGPTRGDTREGALLAGIAVR